ncbi:MAG: hypothetical protein ABIH42_04640 [Planctomycetota bacterium]
MVWKTSVIQTNKNCLNYMYKIFTLNMALLFIFTSGCNVTPPKDPARKGIGDSLDFDHIIWIQPGTTTEKQVTDALGSPDLYVRHRNGTTTLTYLESKTESTSWIFFGWYLLYQPVAAEVKNAILLITIHDGIVEDAYFNNGIQKISISKP